MIGNRAGWLVAVAGTLSCSEGNGPTLVSQTPGTSARATVERTDEQSGNQVHVIYVIPSDGTDRGLDTTGTLATSIAAFQNWLALQANGRRLRFDTYDNGKLDITFHRLSRSNTAVRGYGLFIRDTLEKDLATAGFSAGTKLYAVYYDGGATNTCGGGAWPPQLNGRVAAMYLRGTFTNGARACESNPFASSASQFPGYIDFAMLHEILHTMGIVSPGAPNHVLAGHVNTDPTDLMYAGPLAWAPAVLDVNRLNYFNPAGLPAGRLNLATSPFLLP